VICPVVPQIDAARAIALQVVPIYVAFAVVAPIAGLVVGRMFRLSAAGTRAIAFSAATRNSLVVLPLGLAVPGAVPVLPVIIVTQTLVELLSELVYIRLMPKAGREPNMVR
jgi:ACR3 family arsenite efflux pump ArsB